MASAGHLQSAYQRWLLNRHTGLTSRRMFDFAITVGSETNDSGKNRSSGK